MTAKQSSIVRPLVELLAAAERGGYAVGSFSPRYTPMTGAVLRAAERAKSPVIVQVSQIEMRRVGFRVDEFAEAFWEQIERLQPSVPVTLHLDHTQDISLIQAAIENGFTSVMIDASSKPLEENIAITREVVEFAHAQGVSVEGELGRIASADKMETETDDELYTRPDEAGRFVRETGVDALAVSVGTAHGVYNVRQPKVDLERLQAIRRQAPVHLVLHGGSGVPAKMIAAAIRLPGGGVSKVNIATDLEMAMLSSMGLAERISNYELKIVSPEVLANASEAVEQVVIDKIQHFLGSDGKAGL